MLTRTLGISCLALTIAACHQQAAKKPAPAVLPAAPVTDINLWPQPKNPFDPAQTAAINAKVDALLAKMTLEEKVGQMIIAEMGYITPEQVKQYHVGAVLEAGGALLNKNKKASNQDWVTKLDAYYKASIDTSQGGQGIPIWWGTDAVHGYNKAYGATVFPHNLGLGATHDAALVRKIGEATALETLASGKSWTFAPAVTVVRDDRWGRTYEGYSENPELVAALGKSAILGLQGSLTDGSFMGPKRLMATAKHFVGDGGTEDGVDRANNLDSEKDLVAIHAQSYVSAIEAGVLTIMASHNSWQGTRLHGHHYLLTDVLKGRMGFDGFIVGDWNSHGMIPGCTNSDCPQTINAGLDMVMVPEHWLQFYQSTIAHVKAGTISQARIDDAAKRILRTKFRSGLMNAPLPTQRQYANHAELMSAPEHKALARQAVRDSLVLLKNNQGLLPLNPKQTILIAGEAADNISQACGGWTISWQGTGLDNSDFPHGTSIATGLSQQIKAAGGRVEVTQDGSFKRKPDVAIVVFGEKPYAEWQGDMTTLAYQPRLNSDAKLLEKLQAQGIKTVAVMLSGRPLWMNRELNAADAFVAAWLPGTEGGGVADVVLRKANRKIQYDFTGKLSYSWPIKPDQTANVGDAVYQPLFPFGYGLTYQDKPAAWVPLSTDVDAAVANLMNGNMPVFNGRAKAPWSLFIESGTEVLPYESSTISGKAITLMEADQHTQGDAVEAKWNGSTTGRLALQTPKASINAKELVARHGVVAFDLQVLAKPSAKVAYEMSYAPKSITQQADITPLLNSAPLNEWRRYSVDLACFAKDKFDFGELNQIFALVTDGTLQIRVSNVVIEPDGAAKADIKCQ